MTALATYVRIEISSDASASAEQLAHIGASMERLERWLSRRRKREQRRRRQARKARRGWV